MANEAFALSPISARAALPSEADYDAIREAFMETARGRWFLGEYAKRNRNADTAMVLDAVTRIEATIAAQKQAPANGLQDALVVIRGLLSDAKASAANAMSGPDAEVSRAAVNKGTRIVREIAWTLREYGTDARICDMLDAQVTAIDASERQNIAARDAVLATFDLLIRRIGELGGSGAAPPSFDAERAASPASVVDRDAAAASEAAAVPVEMASETVAEAVVEAAAATTREVIGTPPHHAAAPETPVQETQEASAPPSGPTTAARMTSAPEVIPAELPEQNSVAADAELSTADFEAAQDMAVLDVIALEMAEPEIFEPEMPESEVAGPSVAEPTQTSEPEIVEADLAEPNIAELDESDFAKPDIAKPDIVEPDIVEPDIKEFVTVKAGFAEPRAVEPAFETSIVPEPEPQPEVLSQPSLGASLIASGIVSGRSSPHDALAPIRRMSQAERIAFFS